MCAHGERGTLNRRSGIIAVLSVAVPAMLALSACDGADQVASDQSLRVVSYNIRHGRGMDDSLQLPRTIATLRALNADIVALQEVDERVERSGSVDEAAALGEALGMHHAFGAFMPYQGGRYGLAILSRHAIVESREVRLPDGNEPRVALAVRVRLADGREAEVVNVHFDWVEDDSFRFAQATELTRVLDTLSLPYLLLGDFNDLPPSRTLALFRDRGREVAKPADAHFTFPAEQPVKEIDYVFTSPAAAWCHDSARVVPEPLASDHRPVLAMVTLRHTSGCPPPP